MTIVAPKQVPVIYLGVISLDSEFQLGSSSNNSDIDKSFSSNFCHQEGSGTTFKYPVMSGYSIWLFGHLECLNLSIIDAMGHYSRIRKNVTENRQRTYREQTDNRETNYRGHSIAIPMEHRVEQANTQEQKEI